MLVEEILEEANVEPLGQKRLDQFIDNLYYEFRRIMQHMDPEAFLKRLRKDIINQNLGLDFDYMALYEPKDSDPSYLKTGEVYTIYNRKADIPKDIVKRDSAHTTTTEELKKFIYKELLSPDKDTPGGRRRYFGITGTDAPGSLYKVFKKAYGSSRPDDKEYNEIEPFIRKYEAGKYSLQGVITATQKILSQGPLWQRDPKERERLEKEAPIIMKFDDGFMWVRLDSKQEFAHESEMLGNCLHDYCPPQETPTGKGTGASAKAIYQAWKDAGKPGDNEATERPADYWYHDQREENAISEPITPNLRSLMKWVEKTKEKLYPEAEPDWFEDDLPHGWAHGIDMEGATFEKYESTDHYYAAFIVDYEYFARGPDDPDHEPDNWDFQEIPDQLEGHLVYSLRDKQGESHAAIEYKVYQDSPEQLELKGKQNKDVSKKYMKYVDALNKHWKEHPEDFGGKTKKSEAINHLKHLAGI